MEDLETITKDTQVVQTTVGELLARRKTMNKFEQVPGWKSDIQAAIPMLEELVERLRMYIAAQEAALAELQTSRTELPITKKLFASRQDEKGVQADIAAAREAIDANEETIAGLHDMLDNTPIGKLERKEMLKTLKALQKQLTAEKRAIDQQIRAIKIKARLDGAQWVGVNKGTLGKVARHQRASIRLMKKVQLEPQEAAKEVVKQRLGEVKQKIKWVSGFRSD